MAAATYPAILLGRPLNLQYFPPPSSLTSSLSQLLFRSRSSLARAPVFYAAVWSFSIPAIMSELWESVLRAVPKKKTSYQKKRSRFLAGKALKDVQSLNKCSACGNVKRAHLLCPFCVGEIRSKWKEESQKLAEPK